MMILAVIAGLLLLLFSGDLLVRGSVGLAVRSGVSPLIIGLTIVAFGTSAPELMISLQAAMGGKPGIAVGNVVGSNIANILLVLGVPAVIYPIACCQPGVRRNTIFMIGATLLFVYFGFDGLLDRPDGMAMFALLVAFLMYSGYRAVSTGDAESELDEVSGIPSTKLMTAVFIFAGIIGLPLGAHLLILGATSIAEKFGVSNAVIGLTLVALGTSLPELATTVVAAFRRQSEVAIGNVIGSNLFNILAIMGTTATLTPVPVTDHFIAMDFWILIAVSMILIPFTFGRFKIGRLPGIAFLALYFAYMILVVAGDKKLATAGLTG